MKANLNVQNIIQQIIMYQIFNTANLSKTNNSSDPIIPIQPTSNTFNQDSMDPSRALSETDITDKVHDLSNLPLQKAPIDLSIEERRIAVLRFLLQCFTRVLDERSSNPNVKI